MKNIILALLFILVLSISVALNLDARSQAQYANDLQEERIKRLNGALGDVKMLYNGALSEYGVRISNMESRLIQQEESDKVFIKPDG